MAIACLLGIAASKVGIFDKFVGTVGLVTNEGSLTKGSPLPFRNMEYANVERKISPEWRHPSGRNLLNGSLVAENTPEQRIRLYSAFFDDRESSSPRVPFVVRVIATAIEQYTRGDSPFRCVLLCTEGTVEPEVITFHKRGKESFVQLLNIKYVNNKRYRSFIITIRPTRCSSYVPKIWVGLNDPNPKSFELKKFMQENPSVGIEDPHRVPEAFDLGICTVTYFDLDPYRVLEWVEMQRVLGVTGIVLYNTSLNLQTSRVLHHYYSIGYMDIRQAWRSVEQFYRDEIGLLNQLVLNDCLYRYMHTFKYIMILDPDEVILPKGFSTLPEMISNLSRDNPRVTEYHFLHAFLVTEISFGAKPDFTKPSYSYFLRYRYRTQFRRNAMWHHVKSIFVADQCLTTCNHYCASHFDAKKKTVESFVDTSIAYQHHYRDNVKDAKYEEFFAKDGTMIKPNLSLDDSILAFEDQLVHGIKERIELLEM